MNCYKMRPIVLSFKLGTFCCTCRCARTCRSVLGGGGLSSVCWQGAGCQGGPGRYAMRRHVCACGLACVWMCARVRVCGSVSADCVRLSHTQCQWPLVAMIR